MVAARDISPYFGRYGIIRKTWYDLNIDPREWPGKGIIQFEKRV